MCRRFEQRWLVIPVHQIAHHQVTHQRGQRIYGNQTSTIALATLVVVITVLVDIIFLSSLWDSAESVYNPFRVCEARRATSCRARSNSSGFIPGRILSRSIPPLVAGCLAPSPPFPNPPEILAGNQFRILADELRKIIAKSHLSVAATSHNLAIGAAVHIILHCLKRQIHFADAQPL